MWLSYLPLDSVYLQLSETKIETEREKIHHQGRNPGGLKDDNRKCFQESATKGTTERFMMTDFVARC